MPATFGRVIDGIELVPLPAPDARLLYSLTDPTDLARMSERLTQHPWTCFAKPLALHNEDAPSAIPRYPIVCTSTLATRDSRAHRPCAVEGRLCHIHTGTASC